MTTAELRSVLAQCTIVLEENKAKVSPDLLPVAQRLIDLFPKGTAAGGLDAGQLRQVLDAAQFVVDTETRLLTTPLTDDLVRVLTRLQARPALLMLLAKLV